MIVQNQAGEIIRANPAACKILGLTEDQLLGRTSMDSRWRAILPNGDPFPGDQHPASVCLRTGVPVDDVTMGVEWPNGDMRWLSVSAQPIFDDGAKLPSFTVVTFTDKTEVIEALAGLALANEQLELAVQRADSANAAKSRFLANMSHEIRTPLNGVLGIADALSGETLTPKQAEMVGIIQKSGKSLDILLSDILDLSKVEAGQMSLERRPMDILAMARDVIDLMRPRAEIKGLSLDFEIQSPIKTAVFGDPTRLRQILTNLISNAVKFTETGSVCVQIGAISTALGELSRVSISVRDTGSGFDPALAEDLFERFAQEDETITRRFGGSGVGLSVCKSLVEMMGGQISAMSQPGLGSTFSFWFPATAVEFDQAATEEMPAPSQPFNLEGARVLIAEDHAENQRVIQLLLESFGVEFLIVGDGAQALEAFKNADFDAILMDRMMPIMDGLEAIAAIRAYEQAHRRAKTPIAMLSASTFPEDRDLAAQAGSDVFIPKPLELKVLLEGLSRMMAMGRSA